MLAIATVAATIAPDKGGHPTIVVTTIETIHTTWFEERHEATSLLLIEGKKQHYRHHP